MPNSIYFSIAWFLLAGFLTQQGMGDGALRAKMPKIAFLQGERERSIDKTASQGFDVEPVSLKDEEIPKDITALVINDPKSNFDRVVLTKIERYMVDGGNLLIIGEPGRHVPLNPILRPLGVRMMDGSGAAALSYDTNGPFTITRLEMTDGKSGALPVMLGLTRPIHGKEQRIVVSGDAHLSTTIFGWFSKKNF